MLIKEGSFAPKINLKDQGGKSRNSDKLRGKWLVLFFYPKDDTPGCTAEACSFRDEYDSFRKLGAEVWGISGDNQDSHKIFSDKNKLNFPILIDEGNKLRKEFGVPNSLGVIPGRVTFVINRDGKVVNVFNNLFNGPLHVKNALNIIANN